MLDNPYNIQADASPLRPAPKTSDIIGIMAYDPKIHHRRSFRLRGYDYTLPGAYFVTIVAWRRQPLFGEIIAGEMHLNASGEVIKRCWLRLPSHHPVRLDAWVIMPNHFHAVILLDDPGKGEASASDMLDNPYHIQADASPLRPAGTRPGSLGAIIQNFKSITTRKINQIHSTPGAAIWQRNYYEHIIRSQAEWERIHAYIFANPDRWEEDELYGRSIRSE